MWAFIDIGFAGGIVATIFMVAFVVRYFREKRREERSKSADDPKWKARVARHCEEEGRKFDEWYARHKKDCEARGVEMP